MARPSSVICSYALERGVDNGFVIYKRTSVTFPTKINWHTSKAMQSRVEMNDDYIALDCALYACSYNRY